MSADHYVLLEGAGGDIDVSFICEAPEGAPCRMVSDCECEDGYHSEPCQSRYPDGPPLIDLGECNHALYIEGDGAEWAASGGSVRVPVTTQWHEESYIYDFDGQTP